MRIIATHTVPTVRLLRTAHTIAKCAIPHVKKGKLATVSWAERPLTKDDLELAVINLELLADMIESGNLADTAQAAEQVQFTYFMIGINHGPLGVLRWAFDVVNFDEDGDRDEVHRWPLGYVTYTGIEVAIQRTARYAETFPEDAIDLSPTADVLGFARSEWPLFATLIQDGNTFEDALAKTGLLTDRPL